MTKNRNVLSHNSTGWKSEMKVLAGLVLLEALRENLFHASLLDSDGWQFLAFLVMWPPSNLCLHLHRPLPSLWPYFFSFFASHKDAHDWIRVHLILGWSLLNIHAFKSPYLKEGHILRFLVDMNSGGHDSTSTSGSIKIRNLKWENRDKATNIGSWSFKMS